MADDVVELLDALCIERAVLVGVSMGGGTAVDVALEHPKRVAGLLVSGPGPASVADGTHTQVPGAAHCPNLERPEEFDAALHGLMRRIA